LYSVFLAYSFESDQIYKNSVGHIEKQDMLTKFWQGRLKRRGHLEDLTKNDRIFKYVSDK
jgi:hypothetical protein